MISDLKIQRTILEMPSVFTLPELYNKLGISEHGEASERTHVLEILDELMNTMFVEFADLDDESVVAYKSVLAAEYEEESTKNVGKDYAACDQLVCEGMSKTMNNEEIVERRKGMNDRDYTIFVQQVMAGRTIKSFDADGYGLTITTTDGLVFEYSASDGGYSQSGFSIEKQKEED